MNSIENLSTEDKLILATTAIVGTYVIAKTVTAVSAICVWSKEARRMRREFNAATFSLV